MVMLLTARDWVSLAKHVMEGVFPIMYVTNNCACSPWLLGIPKVEGSVSAPSL